MQICAAHAVAVLIAKIAAKARNAIAVCKKVLHFAAVAWRLKKASSIARAVVSKKVQKAVAQNQTRLVLNAVWPKDLQFAAK